MLSKVLSGRETDRAEAAVFASAAPPPAPSEPGALERDLAEEAALRREILSLRDRIASLEAELPARRLESFEAGQRQGEANARRELAPVFERMAASAVEIAGIRADTRRQAEKDVVNLSLLIAKRILHRELNVDGNALTALARVVFERLARTECYRVTVHPQFATAVQSVLPGSQTANVRIEPDPACAPGTLIVRSDEGIIDASVDAQLEEITRGLIDRLGT